ncbi:MAG: PilZ domain-containing protein [Pseudomonadales bacterium]
MAQDAAVDRARERAATFTSTYLTKSSDVARVLRTLRDQRAAVQLRIDGSNETFTAKVLDVGDREFLLEDIQPRSGLRLLKAGVRFSFSGRVDGLYAQSAENVVRGADAERGLPFFHVPLPKSLLYQQRRKAARFRLPLRVATDGASVTLHRNMDPGLTAQGRLFGRLIDISAGGCRVEFDGPVHPPIDADEVLDTCAITISNQLDFTSKGSIRHFNYNRKTRVVTCGIELTEMHVTDRRRLEQFIQSISRSSVPA